VMSFFAQPVRPTPDGRYILAPNAPLTARSSPSGATNQLRRVGLVEMDLQAPISSP
jgi:hypothetical protein